MSEQNRNNELNGVLFKNERKQKDTHPEYTGSCTIDGKEYDISVWVKESKAGKKYMSLAFRDVANRGGAQNTTANTAAPAPAAQVTEDDDLPF